MKRNARAWVFIAWAALILLLANFANAGQEVEFTYNGRVKHNGDPFDGAGYFKFALVDQAGQTTYWSNDSTSAEGGEPTGYVTSQVIDGFFNVAIGDTLAGMDPLIPTVFNEDERIYLRVWFSHDLGSPFQCLAPDRRVVNPALLGQQSFDEGITLYVDAENGDDSNNGLTTDTAKQSIQAAWNTIPGVVKHATTIQIADGVYREALELDSKTVVGGTTISFVGNVAQPELVRITGAEADAETTPVLECGLRLIDQDGIQISGVLIDYFQNSGISTSYSSVIVQNCKIMHVSKGIFAYNKSTIQMSNVEISAPLSGYETLIWGVTGRNFCYFTLDSCSISDFTHGIDVGNCCVIDKLYGCTINNCAMAIFTQANSICSFGAPSTTISNYTCGIRGTTNSSYTQCDEVTFDGSGTDYIVDSGGVVTGF
ncbi:hypothetical protein JXA32_10140 [Candidatus Sumerlaeota bacterium]|nr:hypothetical protein [Candidatus Sumerlaeota bacterium]